MMQFIGWCFMSVAILHVLRDFEESFSSIGVVANVQEILSIQHKQWVVQFWAIGMTTYAFKQGNMSHDVEDVSGCEEPRKIRYCCIKHHFLLC